MTRVSTNISSINPVLSAKPRQAPHITPLLPGSILASKGQLVIASANSPMIGSSASVITTMSSISLSSSIVTVTPVIMTSTAPLVTLSGNPAVALNPVSQGQVLSSIIQSNVKPCLSANNKTMLSTTYLKPVNIAAGPASFPVAVQPAAIAPAAITLSTAPLPSQQQSQPAIPQQMSTTIPLQPAKEFRLNEFATLELISDDVPDAHNKDKKTVRDENTITSESNSVESRQKPIKSREMYQDENNTEKTSQNNAEEGSESRKDHLYVCGTCGCFGLKTEYICDGRFCSPRCQTSFNEKKNAMLRRGAAKDKTKRKKQKIESVEENGIKNDAKNCEMDCDDLIIDLKEPGEAKKNFCWEEYLKKEGAIAAPTKLFKDFQTYPSNGNGFVKDMKLEGIDPKHPSLFLCFEYIFPVGWCERTNHQLQPPKGFTVQEFDWNDYLKKIQS
ncbi:lethal(3)malignant brain tumor-like protein 3 [Caerostris extrusa]|uniref:Lethal(3)malignant brain tumor-like protein 3 n=1 Tax=Caerostris extrusa TaxID=172846 RepID=A0AAV4WFU1_CAEEX|nr:lethal(3)malignant brain tumor-like protein 3 [Caerostris extrusa]